MDIIGLLPIFTKNVKKVHFFLHLHPFRSKVVSLIIESITYRLGSIVEWTMNGTLVLFVMFPKQVYQSVPII